MNNSFKFRLRFFALMAIFLVSISSAFAQKDTIAIIDAGSSGSRLHVYEVDTKQNTIYCLYPVGKQQEDASKGGALSNVQGGAGVTFLNSMTGKCFIHGENRIALYVLATAGMRTQKTQIQAAEIYNSMRGYKGNGYTLKAAMTISGRYEGLYAWIAVGYETKSLGSSISTSSKTATYAKPPYGIIEIGGASMQITFPVNSQNSSYISRKGFANIYSKSYINGGVNSMYSQMTNKRNSTYKDFVTNLPSIPKDMPFYGLGGTINNSDIASLKNYSEKREIEDPIKHYVSNTYYLQWVLTQLGLLNRITPINADWTKGAAYDIVVNEGPIEPFDYTTPN